MKWLAVHLQLKTFLRRTFQQSLTLVVSLCVCAPLAHSQNTSPHHLPDVDPSREWLGPEYADTLVTLMRTRHPEIELRIDVRDLALFQKQAPPKEKLKKAVEEFRQKDPYQDMALKHRLMNFARNILPGAYQDFLWALEAGNPIKLSQAADHELQKEILEWIHAQPDQSLAPHQLMEHALIKTKGRVVAAWAITWNLIREGWPAAGPRNYGFMQKFVSLTGERHLWKSSFNYISVPPQEKLSGQASIYIGREEVSNGEVPRYFKMIVTKRGDDFSYLYHRLGVELLSMVIAKQTGFSQLGRAGGSLGAFGEWFKFRQTSGLQVENFKRVSNDYTAASSGARLYLLVEKKLPSKIFENQIQTTNYLVSNLKKYNRNYLLPEGRPASYFGSAADPKYWQSSMSVEELTERFFHATRYDSKILNPVILAGGEDYERLHRGLRDYLQSSDQSPRLNQYIGDYLKGMRGIPHVEDVLVDSDFSTLINGDNWKFATQADRNFDFDEYERRLQQVLTRILAAKSSNSSRPIFKDTKPRISPGRCQKVHAS